MVRDPGSWKRDKPAKRSALFPDWFFGRGPTIRGLSTVRGPFPFDFSSDFLPELFFVHFPDRSQRDLRDDFQAFRQTKHGSAFGFQVRDQVFESNGFPRFWFDEGADPFPEDRIRHTNGSYLVHLGMPGD